MSEQQHKSAWWALGALLAVGMVAAAFVLGTQFKNFRQPGTITVKGLAEAPYQADVAEWEVGVSLWGSDYGSAMKAAKAEAEKLQAFLNKQGFMAADIRANPLQVSEHREEYRDEEGRYHTRRNGFVATQTLIVSSRDLPRIQQALAELQNLKAQNDAFTFEQPQYLLSNLESIKRDLIAKATADAQVRAEEFAKTGKVSVGMMRSASQGSFNILSANSSDNDDSDYGGTYDKRTIDKMVRLVVTIEYGID